MGGTTARPGAGSEPHAGTRSGGGFSATLRAAGPASVLIAALTGCGGADVLPEESADSALAPAGPFADVPVGTPSGGARIGAAATSPVGAGESAGESVDEASGLGVRVSLRGASADLGEIDLALDWRVTGPGVAALGPDTTLEAVLAGADGERRSLARTRVPRDAPEGRIDLTLASPVAGSLTLRLAGLRGTAGTAAPSVTVDLPAVIAPPPTPVGRLTSLSAELVPGSASSELRGGRRLHRFSVRVSGASGTGDAPTAVTGLEAGIGSHFLVREGGRLDPESPVRAGWHGEPIAVYLVLDVSSSIVLADADGALVDAVARTLATLAPVASFDYRTVASEVRRLPDLRGIEFDGAGSASGTAFHHALDTALDDIAARGESHAVIVGFTDGRDGASRNFYPALGSDAAVLEHVTGRLRRTRAERARAGDILEAHFASLGDEVDRGALDALASAGGGRHVPGADARALDGAFRALSNELRGRYRLEYSSQRRAGDADLELEVRAGGRSARVPLP